ncbi:MAG: arylsulfatase [Rikenellaceae bacterium]
MTKSHLVFFSFVAASATAYGQEANKPHLIFIMTDQQRGDALGCAGNSALLTPNLDELAREGNLFVNGYSSVPSSTPARAGLLTGMSPWAHGMLGYGNEAERYEYETPRMLNDLGYVTMGIGKMHWYPQYNQRGFQSLLLDESGREMTEDFESDYRKWFSVEALGQDPDLTGIGWNEHRAGDYKLSEDLHPTVWTGQTAVKTIANYNSDKPLYLKVSFARPHSPYDPPKRILEEMKNIEEEPSAPYMGDWIPEEWKNETDPQKNPDAAIGNFGDDYAKNSRLHYYASIMFIDEQVGEIIDELKAKGMYDNALIMFVSDHGDMMGDHCLWRKTYAYEGSTKIPFIVKLPKGYDTHIEQGDKIEYPVELRDVLPTFLAINGAEQPEKMDGSSLLKIYDEKTPDWREYIDLEHSTAYFNENYWCALTDGDIKYIWFVKTGEEQLFDMTKDKGEEHNLAGSKRYAKKLTEMRQLMVEHLSVRGEDWVKDGKLQILKGNHIYGKNFPYEGDPYTRPRL